MSKRISSLSVITNSANSSAQVLLVLQDTQAQLSRDPSNETVTVSVSRIDEDPFDDPEVVDDSKKMLTFRVLEILHRLGMTETEAHTAVTEIHEAGIIFAKKES